MKTQKIRRQIYWIGVSLLVGMLLGWLLFGRAGHDAPNAGKLQESEVTETIWTCSMHPQIRSQEPGECPICGMELIPLQEDQEDTDPLAVNMSPKAMLLAGVSTTVVGRSHPERTINLSGKVMADERRVFSQASHIPGRIESLEVSFTGEFVRKGQVLATVYSPDLVTAQEELLVAYSVRDKQPQLYQATREKLRSWKISDPEIDAMLSSGSPVEHFPVKADISGYVIEKNVNLGDYIPRGMTIYRVTDLSRLWVLFDIYESELPWIRKGDQVSFNISSLPGETFKGKISFIDPILDPMTRVARARVAISNPRGKLKPGMFASGRVDSELRQNSEDFVIPASAVLWTGERSVVYVKQATPESISFRMREVILGPSLGDRYMVKEGLLEGEEIAVNGTFSIDAAAQLAGKPSMMNPEGHPSRSAHDHGGMGNDTDMASEGVLPSFKVDGAAKTALEKLFTAYFSMKAALTKDDLESALRAGKSMRETLTSVNMEWFKGEAHTRWMNYAGSLSGELRLVGDMNDIETLRKTFYSLSATMISLADAFGPLDNEMFVLYCPMARDNSGAEWLSDDKQIRNPYFGSSMLTCGEVRREIKQ